MSRNTGSFLLGAIIGGTAGAVAALLFAPKSGREFRDDLNQQANVLRDTALDYADIVTEKGNVMYQTASDAAQDIRVNLSESAEVLKAQLNEATTEATKQYQVARDEVASAYADAKNASPHTWPTQSVS